MTRHLVIISRDRPELWETFAFIYNNVPGCEIRFDRRYDQRESVRWEGTERRAALARDAVLRDQGFMVIPQL